MYNISSLIAVVVSIVLIASNVLHYNQLQPDENESVRTDFKMIAKSCENACGLKI